MKNAPKKAMNNIINLKQQREIVNMKKESNMPKKELQQLKKDLSLELFYFNPYIRKCAELIIKDILNNESTIDDDKNLLKLLVLRIAKHPPRSDLTPVLDYLKISTSNNFICVYDDDDIPQIALFPLTEDMTSVKRRVLSNSIRLRFETPSRIVVTLIISKRDCMRNLSFD